MASIHLFLMKDKTIVMGEVEASDGESYYTKKPILVQLMQDGQKVVPVSAPFPLPVAEVFLIQSPEFIHIFRDEVRYFFTEDILKKQMIDWYLHETSDSDIQIATDIPKGNGIHLVK